MNAGLAFPRVKLSAVQDTMADCCLLELEDPDWLDPGTRCTISCSSRAAAAAEARRACDTRVEPPPGCDEMVLDFAIGRRAGLGVGRPVLAPGRLGG